jgi:hypothetical protein
MASFTDRIIMHAAMATQPQLRSGMQTVLQRLTVNAFSDAEMREIEGELLAAMSVSEALTFSSVHLPSTGAVTLTGDQLACTRSILSRFRNGQLRQKVEQHLGAALRAGAVRVS